MVHLRFAITILNVLHQLIPNNRKIMQVKVDSNQGFGSCGCGRSPTGKCIGWHGLSEEAYKHAKDEWELNEYKRQAQELWNDSCTSNRSDQ